MRVVVDSPLGHSGQGKGRAGQDCRGACVGEWVSGLPEGLGNAQVTEEGYACDHSYDYEREGQGWGYPFEKGEESQDLLWLETVSSFS